MASSKDWNDGFSAGVLHSLAILSSHGDAGSVPYCEILNAADEDRVIAYARMERAIRWSGLDKYLKQKRQDRSHERE